VSAFICNCRTNRWSRARPGSPGARTT